MKGAPTNCKACKELSVHTNTAFLDLTAATILEPSCILKEPDVLVAVGVHVVKSSCDENRKNKSSLVELSPIVVSVPNKNTCLSGIDTRLNLEVVGACDITVALVLNPADVSHLKVPPL